MLIAFFAIIYKPLNLQRPFQKSEVRDSECLVYSVRASRKTCPVFITAMNGKQWFVMKKVLLSLLIITSAVFAKAQTKSVNLDLLGSSGLAGVSFDSRFIGNHGFGYNVGLSYAYGTGTLNSYSVNGIGIPLEINYLLGQRNSHLVLGLGMTNGIYKYSAQTFFIGYGDDATEIKSEETRGTAWGYNFFGDLGYRFQKEKGFAFGVGIKPTFVFSDGKPDAALLPYLSFGISF